MGSQIANEPVDARVGHLAAEQHGVVAAWQLTELGVGRRAAGRRCARGAWVRVWRGVYAPGHAPLTRTGAHMAAVLACGPGAHLSDASGAEHWQLAPGPAEPHHVTVPGAGGRGLDGIVVHRRALAGPERTSHRGLPVTTAARTVLDHAGAAGVRGTERMLDQAERLALCTEGELREVLAAHAGRPGAGVLRRVLAEHRAGSTVTHSHLEELFLSLCRREGLPQPLVNHQLHGLEVDFYWPLHEVAVETDGWAFHHSRDAQQRDANRHNRLLLAGVLPLRFTYRDLTRQAKGSMLRLRQALRGRGPGL
jgi:very-short-patch-repair endonuclease